MNDKNIIVIPVYKPHMSDDELISLRQCATILSAHDIALVCPQSLDTTRYDAVFRRCGTHFSVVRFDDSYFDSLDSYSRLCLSENFYKRFANYKYMLIYQPDCWVFDDKLQYWCDMGYDYIGAPWSQQHIRQFGMMGHPVGNGGLSLRKIDTMIKLCSFPINQQTVRLRCSFNLFFKNYKRKHRLSTCIINFPVIYIKHLMHRDSIYTKNEDIVIAFCAHKYIPEFSIPDPITAARFSIETATNYFYKKIGGLPFGAHAWNKPEHIKFWQQFIKI